MGESPLVWNLIHNIHVKRWVWWHTLVIPGPPGTARLNLVNEKLSQKKNKVHGPRGLTPEVVFCPPQIT